MRYTGHIEGGRIVLDDGVELPEGAQVQIDIVPQLRGRTLHPQVVKMLGSLPAHEQTREMYYEAMRKKHSRE